MESPLGVRLCRAGKTVKEIKVNNLLFSPVKSAPGDSFGTAEFRPAFKPIFVTKLLLD